VPWARSASCGILVKRRRVLLLEAGLLSSSSRRELRRRRALLPGRSGACRGLCRRLSRSPLRPGRCGGSAPDTRRRISLDWRLAPRKEASRARHLLTEQRVRCARRRRAGRGSRRMLYKTVALVATLRSVLR